MSIPRQVLPGRTYMITRRCTQRQFLMRPDRETDNAFIYCLGVAAERYQVSVIFTVAMSNHHHTGIYDPEANYPAFIEHFHKLFAKCQNALRGRWENFWSSEQTSVVQLTGPDDIIDKMTYALTNPVKDMLVEKSHHWPGVTSLASILHGRPLIASRPRHFFREEGAMPEMISLRFARPQGLDRLSREEFSALILDRVHDVEERMTVERRSTGRRVFGRREVLAQRWSDRPHNHETRGNLNPSLAARSIWSRIEALMRNRDFRDAYIAARAAVIAGVRDVVFPAGTYWLQRFTRATCAPCPAPS